MKPKASTPLEVAQVAYLAAVKAAGAADAAYQARVKAAYEDAEVAAIRLSEAAIAYAALAVVALQRKAP